ncbi:MAG: PaaI family thioesterase [Candidatus Hydrogenedentes bacterium]|nr:PaaI family thioesterase [Candidatus Hydrogenedentota bacterium]
MTQQLPNSRTCFLCGVDNSAGLKLKFYRDGQRVFTRVTLPDWLAGYQGVAHGGIVVALLDEVMGWAANCYARGATATGEIQVRFRHPTPVGEELLVDADVVKSRGRVVYTQGRLLRDGGMVCATGSAKLMKQLETSDGARNYDLVYEPGDARIFGDD